MLTSGILFVRGGVAGPIRDFDDESYPQSSQVPPPPPCLHPPSYRIKKQDVSQDLPHSLEQQEAELKHAISRTW